MVITRDPGQHASCERASAYTTAEYSRKELHASRGGFDYYEGHDQVSGLPVTLKAAASTGASGAELLEHEFRTLNLLAHPGIPRVIDFDSDEAGRHYLVLDADRRFIPLEELRRSRVEWPEVVDVMDRLLEVLEYCHARGFAHCNLSPTSVLVEMHGDLRSGRVVVADFHASRRLSRVRPSVPRRSQFFVPPGVVLETSPGTLEDIYGVGALAVYLLAGAVDDTDVLRGAPSDVLRALSGAHDERLTALLGRVVSPEEIDRPRSASALRRHIAGIGLLPGPGRGRQARPQAECGLVPRCHVVDPLAPDAGTMSAEPPLLTLLVGDAGFGKTATGRLLWAEARVRGYRYLRCTAQGPSSDGTRLTEELRAAAREFGLCLECTEDQDVQEQQSPPQVLGGGRTLCFADDVDKLGEGDCRLLLRLVRAFGRVRDSLLVVATCREVPVCLLERGSAEMTGLRVDVRPLGPMSVEEVRELVADIVCCEVSTETAEWMYARTGGNAAFVGELTRYLAEERGLQVSAEGRVVLPRGALDADVPPTLVSLLELRLGELAELELQIAQIAALGPGAVPDVIARVTGVQRDAVEARLRTLCTRGVLQSFTRDGEVAVAHGMLREVILRGLSKERRRVLHRLVADAWIGDGNRPPPEGRRDAVLAWHLRMAGMPELAAPHALAAATALLEEGRTAECLECLETAAAVIESGGLAPDAMWRFCQRVGELYWSMGRGAPSALAYRTAVDMMSLSGDYSWTERLEMYWGLGKACLRSGDAEGAQRALGHAADLAESQRDKSWLARVAIGLAAVHQMRGEFNETERRADESILLLEGSDLDELRARACMAKGNALVSLCRWEAAKSWYSRAARHATAADDHAGLMGTTCNLGLAHLSLGEWSDAERCFDEALAPARAQGSAYSMALALNNAGILWMRRGALDEAGGRFWEAVKWFEECGDNWGLALAFSNIGELEHARGNDTAAQDLFARSEELMSKAGSIDDLPELYRRRGESLASLGERDEATAVLEQAKTMAEKMESPLEVANCLRALGELACSEGADTKAAAMCEGAADTHRAIGARYELARSLASLGRVLRKLGAQDRATAATEEARSILGELGARHELRALQEEAAIAARGVQPLVRQLPDEPGRLASLYRSSACLAAAESPEALSAELADIMAANVPADVAAVVMLGADGGVTTTISSMCKHGDDGDAVGSLVSVLLAASSADAPATELLDAGTADPTIAPLLKARGLRRVLLVPMVSARHRIGALYLDYRDRDARFSEEEVRFVQALAGQAATAIDNVHLRAELADEIESLRWEVDARYSYASIIGRSLQMQRLFSLLQKVARSSVTVLVEGESGTGKELVARAIHFNGPRKKARFIAQNCAALPEQLLESELFGHVRGAFTGALRDKPGLFEAAHGGTFFLDEIADMPLSLQVKLLRVLQDGEVRRVGATDPVTVDVRIVAATNKRLEEEVRTGRFREDLYYRLNVIRVVMPPLRERRDDIPLLAQHFLNRFAGDSSDAPAGFTDHAMELLVNYDWPGNVRELENELERAVALAKPGAPIGASALSDRIRSVQIAIRPLRPGSQLSLKDMVEDVERRVILQVLSECDWNKSRASEALGLSRQGLLKKIARFGLEETEE